MKTMADLWQAFESQVLPKAASLTQRREMRRAFYAGAFSLLQEQKHIDDRLSDDEGAAMLDAIDQELVAFLSRLGKGFG